MGQEDYKTSNQSDKRKRYQYVLSTFKSLIDNNSHPMSNMCNFLALLRQQFNWWWIGFYFVSKNSKQEILQLGPFQGPLACTLIKKGKGVCGTSWKNQTTIIVKDVSKFEGHIACSSLSKSEIVIPLFNDGKVVGVLDLDSQNLSQFDQIDQKYLIQMIKNLQNLNTWRWVSQKF